MIFFKQYSDNNKLIFNYLAIIINKILNKTYLALGQVI